MSCGKYDTTDNVRGHLSIILPRVSIEPQNEVNDDVNNEVDQQHQMIATISVIVLVAT